eukprot:scaffold12865_cov152-Skeletonema_menzelii.AAC.18
MGKYDRGAIPQKIVAVVSRKISAKHKMNKSHNNKTDLPLPMMDTRPPQPNADHLVKHFDVLCHADQKVTAFYRRLLSSSCERTRTTVVKKYSKKFGMPLAQLMSMVPHYELHTSVPEMLVNRSLVKTYSGRKKDQNKDKIFENKTKQRGLLRIIINFGCIGESSIPIWDSKLKEVVYVKAGSNLNMNDLHHAMKLVGRNIRNVGTVLLLIYQYKTKMWQTKTTTAPHDIDDMANLKKAKQILSALEKAMVKNLPKAKSITRSAWTLASYADPEHDVYFDETMRCYREERRALYLKQLKKWDDSKNITDEKKLHRLFFFHIALIMSGSQGCSDDDGIERLNLLISGKRTGSLSVCIPLRNSDFLEYADFLEDLLASGTVSQGLDMLRVIAYLELAILCETVWKNELPSTYLDIMRVPQMAQKKARVILNGMGIINGVGLDSHVKRFFQKVLRFPYSNDKLDALLHLLDNKTAVNANDNIAEIGQKLNNVRMGMNGKGNKDWEHDKCWLSDLFDDLESIDEEMKDLCTLWLNVYNVSLN